MTSRPTGGPKSYLLAPVFLIPESLRFPVLLPDFYMS
jgi:hypothetical protein